MTQLTEHFTELEMRCPCCHVCKMDETFMLKLENLRIDFGAPLIINSGYRCEVHNSKLLNSSPHSFHLKGLAADISWDEFDAATKFVILQKAMMIFHGIGIGKSYLHVDLGGFEKVWVY